MQDFAFLDQILDRAGHILDRHVRIDTVLVEEVKAVGLETLEGRLRDALDTLGAAVEANGPVDSKTELAGNLHLVTDGRKRLADQLFAGVGAVDFGGIEECDAALVCRAQHRDTLLDVCRRTVVGADAHGTGADFRDLKGPQFPCFHLCLPGRRAPLVCFLSVSGRKQPRRRPYRHSGSDQGRSRQKVPAAEGSRSVSVAFHSSIL